MAGLRGQDSNANAGQDEHDSQDGSVRPDRPSLALDSAISGLNLGEYYTRAGSILIMPPSRGVEVGSWDVTPWAGLEVGT